MKKHSPIALFIGALFTQQTFASDSSLEIKIQQLSAEVTALNAEIKNLHAQTDALANQQEASNSATVNSGITKSEATGATLWGYGEINYNRPKDDGSQTQMDLRRTVFGIGYKFDNKTRLVSEYEVEHAVASSGDNGEVAIEQFYIDHQLNANTHVKTGLFLIPSGLLNDNHEPNAYYGVERNSVETAIIPSTWREGGFAFFGSTEQGIAWDAGVTTTVDLSGWDATSGDGRESPLGSIHQELQLAKAHDLGTYGAVNYRGVPGLVVGGSVFTSKISQGNNDIISAKDSRMALWDIHTRWTPNDWDLSALYAKGTMSNTQAINLTFAGEPTPIPKEFFGYYAQVAYKVWQNGSYKLSPFVRYEGVNTASAYEQPQSVAVSKTEHITTVGASFYLNPNVVIKLDYQDFEQDTSRNSVNMGLGLAF